MNIEGERFFYRAWRSGNPRVTIVLLHALGLHTGRYSWLCDKIARGNVNCYAVDLYGHGLSDGGRGRGSLKKLIEVASMFLNLVRDKEKGEPRSMFDDNVRPERLETYDPENGVFPVDSILRLVTQ